MPVETTWDARIFFLSAHATSQIVSFDLATGKRTERTSGPGLKLMPQFLPGGQIGFLTKAGKDEGVGYTRSQAGAPTNLGANAGVAYTKQDGNFDIYTIKPDGTDLRRLTTFARMMRTRSGRPTADTSCGTAESTG
jgi:hypothetical protein